ncbi:hypothetical protein ACWC5I_09475 [Kitasatospora sp. NPDC001574]
MNLANHHSGTVHLGRQFRLDHLPEHLQAKDSFVRAAVDAT